ncbi:unnamed protein product [Ceutorhynchus assimilis]|uniref:Uncharacterized protein n=1 Tax=Ceutorhynchus assimilis TaxID=467358 RepID=A0A9N9MDA1_9CUCU|nr:unnamed protein product [Ceutorhynchus assimilis]
MTNIGIDEVLRRLSIKFNKIFYDREFVESVSEDLERIINNANKCCLLVFPSFSPNYLRVARYQAKLCDLAVIELRSGSSKSIGVCHKKYLLVPDPEVNGKKEEPQEQEQSSKQMAESTTNTTIRKKRPPIQLYIPPAQRKSRLGAILTENKDPIKNGNRLKSSSKGNIVKPLLDKCEIKNIAIKKGVETNNIKLNKENNRTKAIYCSGDVDYFYQNFFPYFSHKCNNYYCVKFFLFKEFFPNAKLLIFSIKRLKYSFHWIRSKKENPNIVMDDTNLENRTILGKINLSKDICKTSNLGLFLSNSLDFTENRKTPDELLQFQNSYCLSGKRFIFYLPDYMYNFYVSVPDFKIVREVKPDEYLRCYPKVEDYLDLENCTLEKCFMLPQIISKEVDLDNLLADNSSLQKEKSDNCDNKSNENCANLEVSDERILSPGKKMVVKAVDKVIVLEERIELPKIDSKSISPPPIAVRSKQNEHEQEKEIMRKAKQNINRKTRPIIKYIDDDNDTLNIGKGDNINNWEDLFNDDGELQDDIFDKVIHKVGADVTILKATEDYLSYGAKEIEELEHMVELYDFPSTLETNDIISSFCEIKSDSMYVKWVDDTHAILVLGSSLQAQKALALSNQLIKVRPMSAASSLALEKANQFDLRPAMKRPQTNLQTARRLITSHLGTRSKISREQSSKEREDLRLAKELKKKTKQNELDAWEGNLRSSINN